MLVEQHATAIYRLAATIVGEAEARDLVQETFTAAWTQLSRLRDPEAFGAWLRRICVNRCRNVLRAGRRRRTDASLEAQRGWAEGLPDPRADFRVGVEARMVLTPAFERLSADQRAVLALHYGQDLSISQAAAAMDVRVGTAKSRLNSALSILRRELAAREPRGRARGEVGG